MSDLSQGTIIVSGHVQGVFYRAFASRVAKSLGLKGYVRNLPRTNEVEVCVEGDKSKIEELVGQLEIGPPESLVENISVDWANFTGEFVNFEVR